MLPLLLGSKGAAQCIQWREQPPESLCIRRPELAVGGEGCLRSCQEASREVARRCSRSRRARRKKTEGFWSDSAEDLNAALNLPLCAQSRTANDSLALQDATDRWRSTSESSLSAADECSAQVEPGFVFHQANAFRSADGHVVVDCVRYPRMPTFNQPEGVSYADWVEPGEQPISQLWRYTLDPATGFKSSRRLCARAAEFPAVNPSFSGREHRFLYAAAALHPSRNAPQQAVLKLDLHSGAQKLWQRDSRFYVGEPIFVPTKARGAEDEGWLLCICYDAQRRSSECVILDAQEMDEVAALSLRHCLPHGLHGTWSMNYYKPSP